MAYRARVSRSPRPRAPPAPEDSGVGFWRAAPKAKARRPPQTRRPSLPSLLGSPASPSLPARLNHELRLSVERRWRKLLTALHRRRGLPRWRGLSIIARPQAVPHTAPPYRRTCATNCRCTCLVFPKADHLFAIHNLSVCFLRLISSCSCPYANVFF